MARRPRASPRVIKTRSTRCLRRHVAIQAPTKPPVEETWAVFTAAEKGVVGGAAAETK